LAKRLGFMKFIVRDVSVIASKKSPSLGVMTACHYGAHIVRTELANFQFGCPDPSNSFIKRKCSPLSRLRGCLSLKIFEVHLPSRLENSSLLSC
jgi:hypothetical protein